MTQYTEYCDQPNVARAQDVPKAVVRLTDELDASLAHLENTAQTLWERLYAVLAPSYPIDTCESEQKPDTSVLRGQVHRVCAVTESLRSLIDRLEV